MGFFFKYDFKAGDKGPHVIRLQFCETPAAGASADRVDPWSARTWGKRGGRGDT